jgi:hypothetical protein
MFTYRTTTCSIISNVSITQWLICIALTSWIPVFQDWLPLEVKKCGVIGCTLCVHKKHGMSMEWSLRSEQYLVQNIATTENACSDSNDGHGTAIRLEYIFSWHDFGFVMLSNNALITIQKYVKWRTKIYRRWVSTKVQLSWENSKWKAVKNRIQHSNVTVVSGCAQIIQTIANFINSCELRIRSKVK